MSRPTIRTTLPERAVSSSTHSLRQVIASITAGAEA
jgi:hypothetical protein